ncbi:hypothetical protein MF271_14670 [Deinococcus sp. KNUC1210]|uniref:hypothetical protein n=1 Tax=Deinococcus sp. KNUC1210 TaxID=2917691 RepID=UPI001EF06FEA|nr:hypothetical protein [Deinococcus sp. KNUC1210]ULH15183.1 hypothetical protein MF271_14670 [Deinococcus sp. KNUC1210]
MRLRSWLVPPLLALALSLAQAVTQTVAPVLVTSAGNEDSMLLGVWDGKRWLSPPAAAPLVRSGTAYRVQGLTGPSLRAVGGLPVSFDAPCPDAFSVTLKPSRVPDATQIVTRADLNARPRPVTALPIQNSLYTGMVGAELLRRGLKNPVVQIRSVTRADLDGNGSDEIIIEATHFAESAAGEPLPPVNAQAGDYSVLLLRFVVNGQVKTAVLGADVVLKSGNIDAPRNGLRERLQGIADLNGDGRMEIMTSESYYEGDTLDALTWTPTQGPKRVLETGCGS